MPVKQIIQRNLPLTTAYIMTAIHTGTLLDDGFTCICQNCDKLLVNYATIENEKGESFDVGLDCMKTLTMKNVMLRDGITSTEMLEYFNQAMRFIGICNKPDTQIFKETFSNGSYCFRAKYLNAKAKDATLMESSYYLSMFMDINDFLRKYDHKITDM